MNGAYFSTNPAAGKCPNKLVATIPGGLVNSCSSANVTSTRHGRSARKVERREERGESRVETNRLTGMQRDSDYFASRTLGSGFGAVRPVEVLGECDISPFGLTVLDPSHPFVLGRCVSDDQDPRLARNRAVAMWLETWLATWFVK
jgi:hypothetical protein